MAKLFTNHDPYRVHTLVGASVLLHFTYRLYCVLYFGVVFPSWEPLWTSTWSVLLHGALAMTAFIPPVPSKRLHSAPMIWPEFRMHSAVFAMRHVCATLLTLHNMWPESVIVQAVARFFLLALTTWAASRISFWYGDSVQRTTNCMPYPSCLNPQVKDAIKWNYMDAQFAASKMVLSPDAAMCWIPLLGIQIAPFLMTLVRKGKIGALTYHRVYAMCLSMGYVYAALSVWQRHPAWEFILVAGIIPVRQMRLAGWSSSSCWGIFTALVPLVHRITDGEMDNRLAGPVMVLSCLCKLTAYAPLVRPFLCATLHPSQLTTNNSPSSPTKSELPFPTLQGPNSNRCACGTDLPNPNLANCLFDARE